VSMAGSAINVKNVEEKGISNCIKYIASVNMEGTRPAVRNVMDLRSVNMGDTRPAARNVMDLRSVCMAA
jgi:hypothetical protein